MTTRIMLLMLACACLSGCISIPGITYEPFPAVQTVELRTDELPPPVRSAVLLREPQAEVVKVVGRKFKTKITSYEVTVREAEGGEKPYLVSADGKHCELKSESL
ncbi:MAG: hypothetical protein JJU29_05285 [Verrucomicrobia bacterium]|nr:hypothetical protein [Verrucomicrobiota bacterium]MCH8511765.1 hypothetical protein [Kiritimatiellia bacterium]